MSEQLEQQLDQLRERLRQLEPLLYEVARRAEKELADDGYDFTVTVDSEMWRQIKDAL